MFAELFSYVCDFFLLCCPSCYPKLLITPGGDDRLQLGLFVPTAVQEHNMLLCCSDVSDNYM
jgi:hypothetical protein